MQTADDCLHYRDFEIPHRLLQKTGSGAEHFELIGQLHEQVLAAYAPVEPTQHVLDMGCGVGRDALLLLDDLGPTGRYTGFDVDRESIEWCSANISARYPGFRFHHLDVYSKVYNPNGRLRGKDVRFPTEDSCVDRAIAHSLFTHLLEEDAVHYLSELARVLRPGGLALLTFFVATRAEMHASCDNLVAAFRFPHPWSDGVYVTEADRPEDGVAVTPETLARWLRTSDLKLARPLVLGSWLASRREANPFGQDLIVVERAR